MAEVSVAVATAVVKLERFLQEQDGFLNVKKDVEWLIEKLNWIQSFLNDPEMKPDGSHLSIQWKSDVRDLASECEYVIDTFLVELGEPKTLTGCLGVMPNCCNSHTTNLRRTHKSKSSTHKLKSEIRRLKTELEGISNRRNRYGLNVNDIGTSGCKNEVEKLMDLRSSTTCVKHELVGHENTLNLLMAKLINGSLGRLVICIIGMGGLGKTTLAWKLYELCKQNFTSFAWICVSQVYDHQEILLQLIKSMTNPSERDLESLTDTKSMESYLYEFLCTHQFLVVLDDLWEREAWEMLQIALPDNNKGSRIIITSRNIKVATSKAYVHELRYLKEDECWKLFCKKAFPYDNNNIISPRIENLGKEMVAKCLGLPLAIVTLGGLLSTKSNSVSEWKLIRDYLWKELEKDSMHISALLSLSYKDLPAYLKPCFLYVGMFPEDFEIPISKLILLWVAEGFIVTERESVAKSYFNELVGRSLFQRKGEDWIGSTFRVHGLLRDLAIKRAEDEGFFVYYDENQLNNLTDRSLHRRLVALQPQGLLSRYKNHSLRTLFIGSPEKDIHMDNHQESYNSLQSVHMHYGLLRVIDIHVQGFMHQQLPKEIGRLIHLRYLGLHMLKAKENMPELPDTIGNLKALQTLCVTSDVIQPYMALPTTMANLESLKHLIGNFSLGEWIGELNCLETLQEITYEQWCGIDTTNLVNLRHLSLTNVPRLEANPARFYDKFRTTINLQKFSLEKSDDFELASISLSRIFECCPYITHFKSNGINFENSALLRVFAIKIEVLDVVYHNNFQEDPIPLFERLPQLRALRMEYYNATVQQIVCSGKGFPQLRTLVIELGPNVTLVVEEGGMPLLTCLMTKTSQNLKAPKRLMDLIVKF